MCTTICVNSGKDYIIVNNQGTFFEKGFLFTNNREMKKRALLMPPAIPLEWVSIYPKDDGKPGVNHSQA